MGSVALGGSIIRGWHVLPCFHSPAARHATVTPESNVLARPVALHIRMKYTDTYTYT